MAKFRKKPVVVEAIAFDELIEHAKAQGAAGVNGSNTTADPPVSFEWSTDESSVLDMLAEAGEE